MGIVTGTTCIPGVTFCVLEEEQAEMSNASASGKTPVAFTLRVVPGDVRIGAVYLACDG
jgi:hypothetical protein